MTLCVQTLLGRYSRAPAFPPVSIWAWASPCLAESLFALLWTIQLDIQSFELYREPLRPGWEDLTLLLPTKKEMGTWASIPKALFFPLHIFRVCRKFPWGKDTSAYKVFEKHRIWSSPCGIAEMNPTSPWKCGFDPWPCSVGWGSGIADPAGIDAAGSCIAVAVV